MPMNQVLPIAVMNRFLHLLGLVFLNAKHIGNRELAKIANRFDSNYSKQLCMF